MEIIVAKTAGFCFGVKNAVNKAYKNIENNKKIVTYGPIIHNKYVIKDLEKHGVYSIDNLEDVKDETVLIRSHGVKEDTYSYMKNNNINYVDCTCPYVKKIHKYVEKKFKEGNKIIIVGDKNHPEVIGINSYGDNKSIIIKNVEELDNIILDKNEKYVVVVQTTFIKSIFDEIIKKLKTKIDNIEMFNTICNATKDRQKEADEISKIVDIMIILGDKKSSNTSKLYEVCKKNCKNSFLIENIHELQLNKFNSDAKIGITAGASTPYNIIEEAIYTMDKELNIEDKTFEEMLNESIVTLHVGSIVKGKIIQISNNELILDISGYKVDGIVPKNEISYDDSIEIKNLYKINDELEAYVVKINDGEGNVLLSLKRTRIKKDLEKIEKAFKESTTIKGTVKEIINGGLLVMINEVRGFVPSSQISYKFISNVEQFKDQELDFNVIEFNKEKNRIILSRKEISKKEEEQKKKNIIDKLNISDIIDVTVNKITNFGVFVDIGGIDGLVHISKISWGKVNNISDFIKVGDKLKAKILDIDKKNYKISLSLKDTINNPWNNIEKKYKEGDIVEGKVVRITNFGCFIELEDGIDGLVHISQISNSHVKNVEDVIKLGEMIKVKIKKVDKENKKINLSKKEAENMVVEVHEPNSEIPNSHWENTVVEKYIDEVPNCQINEDIDKPEEK